MIQHSKPSKRKRQPAKPPTDAQRKRQRAHALLLCRKAATPAAWLVADRMAQAWIGCGCTALGIPQPEEVIAP